MGSFRRPKYEETAADKAVREDIERRRAEELEEQRKNEEAKKKLKSRLNALSYSDILRSIRRGIHGSIKN